VLGDSRNVSCFGNAVLLKRAVDGVAREKRLGAERLVGLLAETAGEAGSVEPFDTCVVADFNVIDQIAFRNYDARTLVAADERELGRLAELSVTCEFLLLEARLTRGQSPLTAWRSVWQTPENLMLTRTSSEAGFCTGIFL